MKNFLVVILFAILLCLFIPTLSIGSDKYGFADINFSDSREKVLTYLKEKYPESNVVSSDIFVWFNDLKFGNKKVGVVLVFDNNDKMYSFCFESDKVSADDFEYKLMDDVIYFNTVFKRKYGNPRKVFKVSFYDVNSNTVSYVNKWDNKDYEIYTGITSYKFRYYAVACVTCKKMERALIENNKNNTNRSSKEAADSF